MDTKDKSESCFLFKKLGKGSFGTVYLTLKGNNPELLATKVICVNVENKNLLDYLNNEIEIMKILKHPNIIRLDNFIKSNNYYYVIMEYCNGGNLSDLLTKYKKKFKKTFPIEIIQYFMRQIVEGLKYLHSFRIIHRDLKLENILINFNNIWRKTQIEIVDFNELDDNDLLNSTIKIIDFGLSKKLGKNQLADSYVGSPIYMDPIILKKYKQAGGYEKLQGYNEKADIWSLGIIFYQMLTGDRLFNINNPQFIIEKLKEHNYSIPIDIDISNEIISFLKSMLQYDGKSRLSAEELSKHDFLRNNIRDFTKITYQKNLEEKDISYINIQDMKNSIYINKVENFKNSKIIYLNYINNLLKDYKAAKEYFKENGLLEREKDADQKCKQLDNIKIQLNSSNKVYKSSFPKEITREYIYGSSIEERDKKFKEILSRYRAEKNLLEVKLKENNEINNEIGKNYKDEYEKNKIKYNDLKTIIEDLEKKFKNIWTPAPLYIKENRKVSKEIISFDKSEFKIKTQIKRIDNINDSLDLIISFIVNEGQKLKKKLKLNKQNNCEEWTWILSSEEWMNIDNNIRNFMLEIKIDKFFSKEPNIYVDVKKIKNGIGLNIIQQINDNGNKQINILILPILPKGEKSEIIEEKEIISVQKIYPPFMKSIIGEKPPQIKIIY